MTIHQRRDDYPNPWRIQVRGHPARRESISWREAIRDAVTDTYPQAPFTSPPMGTKFTVEVIFRMTPEDLARPAFDLDNFAKPVLDTLFTSQNVSRLTGVLLPEVNDTWVFRLLLEKVGVWRVRRTRVPTSRSLRTHRVPRISALLRLLPPCEGSSGSCVSLKSDWRWDLNPRPPGL